MIISAAIIKNPRRLRWCATCNLPARFNPMRLYGAANRGEPPYVIHLCEECAQRAARDSVKIADALRTIAA
jgi:hypothetical protein